jgi:hypothetical protein
VVVAVGVSDTPEAKAATDEVVAEAVLLAVPVTAGRALRQGGPSDADFFPSFIPRIAASCGFAATLKSRFRYCYSPLFSAASP